MRWKEVEDKSNEAGFIYDNREFSIVGKFSFLLNINLKMQQLFVEILR